MFSAKAGQILVWKCPLALRNWGLRSASSYKLAANSDLHRFCFSSSRMHSLSFTADQLRLKQVRGQKTAVERANVPILLETDELEALLDNGSIDGGNRVVPVDATWYLQPVYDKADLNSDGSAFWDSVSTSWKPLAPVKDAKAEFCKRHIPGAQFFDIDAVADTSQDLPHMLPSVAEFEKHMGQLSIKPSDHVVVYDSHGIFSSPRVYWTFKVFGHSRVSILNGGLPKWIREGRRLSDSERENPGKGREDYRVERVNDDLVINYDTVIAHISDWDAPNRYQMVDARSKERWEGSTPDPRPFVKPGHMPGSYNVPYVTLLDTTTGCFRPVSQLVDTFERAGLVRFTERPLAMTCGSGITACVLFVAAKLAGAETVTVYDGSWAEYGRKKESFIRIKPSKSF